MSSLWTKARSKEGIDQTFSNIGNKKDRISIQQTKIAKDARQD